MHSGLYARRHDKKWVHFTQKQSKSIEILIQYTKRTKQTSRFVFLPSSMFMAWLLPTDMPHHTPRVEPNGLLPLAALEGATTHFICTELIVSN